MCRSRRRSRIASMRIWSPSGSNTYRSGWARLSTRSGEPSSSAANATAAARLPTPGGPCSRYACAGPSASAARSRRFASGCSGKLSNLSTDLHGEVAGRLRAVERDHPLGKHRGQLPIGPVHGGAVVTARAGFIGSHVADALVARGGEVHVLDNLTHGSRENVPERARLHEGDIRTDADSVFDEARPEACFHLAAQADVRVSVDDPVYDADVNVLGTLRVLEAGRPPRGKGG